MKDKSKESEKSIRVKKPIGVTLALVIGLVLVISSLASDSGRKESTPCEIMPEHEPEYPDEDMTMKEDD